MFQYDLVNQDVSMVTLSTYLRQKISTHHIFNSILNLGCYELLVVLVFEGVRKVQRFLHEVHKRGTMVHSPSCFV